jgi:cytochrome c oxidase subunit 4
VAHDAAHSHGPAAHGHGAHGKDHVPHVTPFPTYLKTFGALMVLTIITVAVSRVDLGTTTNLFIALAIATVKATIVGAMFMHLYADRPFHTVIFVSSVVFLFIFIIFTSFDLFWRGKAEAIEKDRPYNSAKPWEAAPATPAVTAAPAAPKH